MFKVIPMKPLTVYKWHQPSVLPTMPAHLLSLSQTFGPSEAGHTATTLLPTLGQGTFLHTQRRDLQNYFLLFLFKHFLFILLQDIKGMFEYALINVKLEPFTFQRKLMHGKNT